MTTQAYYPQPATQENEDTCNDTIIGIDCKQERVVLSEKNINSVTTMTKTNPTSDITTSSTGTANENSVKNKEDKLIIPSSPPSSNLSSNKRKRRSLSISNKSPILDEMIKNGEVSNNTTDDLDETTCVPTSSSSSSSSSLSYIAVQEKSSMNKRIKLSNELTELKSSEIILEEDIVSDQETQTQNIDKGNLKNLDNENIDVHENDKDITLCSEYSEEIFEYLYQRETHLIPQVNYCAPEHKTSGLKQYLRPSMRAILIDWLIQVHENFKLFPETLFLGINIMDRFMSVKKVSLSKLQLLAITSLFIAAKYEEVVLPKLEKYCYMTDNAYNQQQLKEAEMFILNTLNFEISLPNHLNFLRRFNKADNYNFNYRLLAKYYLEVAVSSPLFINETPSTTAAMATYLARMMYNIKQTSFYEDQKKLQEQTQAQEEKDEENLAQSSLDPEKWTAQLTQLGNGLDPLQDTEFQQKIWLLVHEVNTPATQLKSLDLKYDTATYNHVGPTCKQWCNEIVKCLPLSQDTSYSANIANIQDLLFL